MAFLLPRPKTGMASPEKWGWAAPERPERPAGSGGGTRRAEAKRRSRAYARLAGDEGGPSRERRPLPRRRERPSNSAAARKRGDRFPGGRQPSRAPAEYRECTRLNSSHQSAT